MLKVWLLLSVIAVVFNRPLDADMKQVVGLKAPQRAARKLADSFMFDVIQNRISDALEKFEGPYLDLPGRSKVRPELIKSVVNSCGAPLNMKIVNDGSPNVGESISAEGEKHVVYTFIYSAQTTRPKRPNRPAQFTVSVEVVGENEYVVGFGCCCATPLKSKANSKSKRT